MNTKTRIMSGITALALTTSVIAMAPAAQAGQVVPSPGDKQVVKVMKKVVKFAKQSQKNSNRATANCIKISGMSETSKSRPRLIRNTMTVIVSAMSNAGAGENLFRSISVDYENAKQAAAADTALNQLGAAGVSLDVAFATCVTIPEIDDFINGTPVVE